MTEKLSKQQREQLKRLVLQCVLSRFTTIEALHYIREKLHNSISRRYYFQIKRKLANNTNKQLAYFTENKDAYLYEFHQCILEIQFLQKKMWELYDNNEKDPKFQLDCIKELRMLTMTLMDRYKILPSISGFEFQYESDNNQSVLLKKDNEINWTGHEKEAFEDEANDSGEAKF
jgi:hypothetical protein